MSWEDLVIVKRKLQHDYLQRYAYLDDGRTWRWVMLVDRLTLDLDILKRTFRYTSSLPPDVRAELMTLLSCLDEDDAMAELKRRTDEWWTAR